MKDYYAKFNGRLKGAIGIFYQISTMVKGYNKKDAELNLYKTYEHILFLRLEEV